MDFALPRAPWIAALDPGFVLTVFLLSLRLAAVLFMTPLLHAFNVPAVVRVLLVMGLAAGLALGLPDATGQDALSWSTGRFVSACLTEVALGATLALAILAAFAAISLAGRLIDLQIGFGMAQVLDPATQRQIPVLTSAFNQAGVLVFFLVNGHHALLRGISYSLERFPLGSPWPAEMAAPTILKQIGGLFTLGIALAAPVVVCLLLVELALGVVARNLPQMNMFVIAIPVKVVIGLAALSIWFASLGVPMTRIYGSIYATWDSMFAAAPGARAR